MELISKLEKTILGWVKNVPHLPPAGQKWLGANVWWLVLIAVIIMAIAVLGTIGSLFTLIALIGAASSLYYVAGTGAIAGSIVAVVISLVFLVVTGLLLAVAIKPLKDMQKKGWVLLFMTLLVEALSVVVHAVLSFSPLGFVMNILFGAIGVAIGAYFIFEIHGQFGHHVTAKTTHSAAKPKEV